MNSQIQSDILKTTLLQIIRRRHADGAYGVIVEGLEGMPKIPLTSLFDELGGPNHVAVSLIGAPDGLALVDWARDRGWDALGFGVGSTHAVNVRNNAPPDAIKLVLIWQEEESPERLHSLVHRGYHLIGQNENIRQLCQLGAERARTRNEPQQHLWEALASEKLSALVSLTEVLDYYVGFFEDENADPLVTPRQLLPVLGFLPDPQLLTARYSSVQAITSRLLANAAMVERLQRADEEDRKAAVQTLQLNQRPHDTRLSKVYHAFLRISRGHLSALRELTLPEAELLLAGKRIPQVSDSTVPPEHPQPLQPQPSDMNLPEDQLQPMDDDENGADKPEGISEEPDTPGDDYDNIATDDVPPPRGAPQPQRRDFPNLAVAAVQLVAEGEHETVEQLVEKAVQTLKRNEIQSDRLKEGRVTVEFNPDVRAVMLSRVATEENRFGGSLLVSETSLDELLKELGQYIEQFGFFDEVRLRKLENLLRRARENLLPSFEGDMLLREYLDRRIVLLPFADLLATSSMSNRSSGSYGSSSTGNCCL